MGRILAVGMGAGLLLMAVMYYPLYVALPGQYVADWPGGSQVLAIGASVCGGLLLLLAGAVAAFWNHAVSRTQGAWRGALAGAVSGSMLFAGLGAAAAGVIGSQLLWTHGLKPAADEKQFAFLLAEPVVSIFWWTYLMFWGLTLSGSLLGAIGGLLIPPKSTTRSCPSAPPDRHSTLLLALILLLMTALSLSVLLGALQPLPYQVNLLSSQFSANKILTFSPQGIFYWFFTSKIFFFLSALLWIKQVYRSEYKRSLLPAQTILSTSYLIGSIILLVWIAVYLTHADFIKTPALIGSAILSLFLGADHCTGQKIKIADIVDKYDALAPLTHSRAASGSRAAPLACLVDLRGCFESDQIHSEKHSWLGVYVFLYESVSDH